MKFSILQIAKLTLIIILLVVAPFISGSHRTSYVYFLLNILIVALGLESGLIGVRSGSSEDKKTAAIAASGATSVEISRSSSTKIDTHTQIITKTNSSKSVIDKLVETPPVKKIAVASAVKKSPSRPSLFFIGSFEEEEYHHKEEDSNELAEKSGEISAQELFFKAEAFIGNFYKQLKMQREESWKKIHGLYKKAF